MDGWTKNEESAVILPAIEISLNLSKKTFLYNYYYLVNYQSDYLQHLQLFSV